MRNVFLIIKHEISTTLRKRSFWLTTFLLPGVILALSLGSQALARSSLATGGSNPLLGSFTSGRQTDRVCGCRRTDPANSRAACRTASCDKSARCKSIPIEAAAQAALASKEINKYYMVPADFIQTGDLIVVDSNFSVFNSLINNDYFEYVLRVNLVKDAQLAELLDDPTANVKTQALAPRSAKSADGFGSFGVPFAVLMIFYLVITMTGGFMLQSVTKEKENRTIEVLLLSVRPRDLMLGKILGLGVVALLQIAVWGGVMLVFGGVSVNGLSALGLPARFLRVGAAVFCIWGIWSMLRCWALWAQWRPLRAKGRSLRFIMLLPLFIPLMLNSALIEAPNSGLTTFLSLFPLTSPVTMITRLAAGQRADRATGVGPGDSRHHDLWHHRLLGAFLSGGYAVVVQRAELQAHRAGNQAVS